MKRLTQLVALMLILTQVSAFAQITAVPQLMHFSGRLTNPDGTPVADSNYSIRFSLWTAATGGIEKWSQTISPVTVKNGTFSVQLNTSTGDTDKFHNHLWLEIKIGSDAPLTPRQQLVSVAYAMKADSVRDGSVTSTSIADGTITVADLASNTLNALSWLLNGNANPSDSSFLGTTTSHPLNFKVNNRRAMQYTYVQNTSSSDPEFHYRGINVLGGADINSISPGVIGATVVGGGQDFFTGDDHPNTVTNNFGTVVGGALNQADLFGFVGGGYFNQALGESSTVAGGAFNLASNDRAFVGGGTGNRATGYAATIPGGHVNSAAGDFSFAGGRYAQALHSGSFVWADASSLYNFASTGDNQFLIQANGGVGIGVNRPQNPLSVGGGVTIDQNNLNNGTFTSANGDSGLHFGSFSGEGIASRRTPGGNQYGLDFYTGNQNRLSIANWGGVGIGTQEPAYTLHVNGNFGVSNLPFGDRRNVQWDINTGQFYQDNSSRRYKENITPLKEDFFKLLDAQPVTYTRPGAPDRWEVGFIAEDFDALGLKRLVDYQKDGKTPDGINYEKICIYLTAIAKQQEDRLKSQESQLKTLETENTELKSRLTAIETSLAEAKAHRK